MTVVPFGGGPTTDTGTLSVEATGWAARSPEARIAGAWIRSSRIAASIAEGWSLVPLGKSLCIRSCVPPGGARKYR